MEASLKFERATDPLDGIRDRLQLAMAKTEYLIVQRKAFPENQLNQKYIKYLEARLDACKKALKKIVEGTFGRCEHKGCKQKDMLTYHFDQLKERPYMDICPDCQKAINKEQRPIRERRPAI